MTVMQPSSNIADFNQCLEVKRCHLHLPYNYKPGSADVISGRGKSCSNHEGNKNLQSIVASKLEQYSIAASKREKSRVLHAVIDQIRTGKPQGKFIKWDPKTKRWFDIGDHLAKERISQSFRDSLADLYKSSNGFKKKRRIEMKQAETMLSIKRARLQLPCAGEKQNFCSLETIPSSALVDTKKNGANTLADLPHIIPLSEKVFKEFPMKAMPVRGGRIQRKMHDLNQDLNTENRFYSDVIQPSDVLEEIDTTGLTTFGIEATMDINFNETYPTIGNRTCFDF